MAGWPSAALHLPACSSVLCLSVQLARVKPLLLDNINPAILPISQRLDLHMQFAFGDTHLYRFEQNNLQAVGKTELLPHWTALLAKLENEGLLLANGNVTSLLPLLQSSARHIPDPAS